MTTAFESIRARVARISDLARDIKAVHLEPVQGELAPFSAGAHIDVKLPNGLVRAYSLCNSQDDRDQYVIAVGRARDSRGGSNFIHDSLRAGDELTITGLRNNFALSEGAPHSVFVAGGSGITPILSMIRRLESIDRSWELHYSTRLRENCAFHDELELLEQAKPGRVHFNFDHQPGGKPIDFRALFEGIRRDAHIYCCGPIPMLNAFQEAGEKSGLPQEQIHLEFFSAVVEAALDGGFTVVLNKSQLSYQVPAGSSILEVLLENDIEVGFSCMEGTCRSCEATLLEGIPDHRDSVLSQQEKDSNKRIMLCCSGSKTPTIVLDL